MCLVHLFLGFLGGPADLKLASVSLWQRKLVRWNGIISILFLIGSLLAYLIPCVPFDEKLQVVPPSRGESETTQPPEYYLHFPVVGVCPYWPNGFYIFMAGNLVYVWNTHFGLAIRLVTLFQNGPCPPRRWRRTGVEASTSFGQVCNPPPSFRVRLADREKETCNWGCVNVRIAWCPCSCSSNCPSRKKLKFRRYTVGEYRNGEAAFISSSNSL